MLFGLVLSAALSAADPHLVWRGPNVTLLGAPSRDGSWLSYIDGGQLALRDLHSERTLKLTHGPAKQFGYFSVISPDSRHVAYAWFNDRGFYELRLVGVDGEGERVLHSNEEAGFVQPCAFTPDGKQILTLLFRKDNISQIALIPADGGPPRVLRSLNWVYPKRMDLSPDGKQIVYDSFAADDNGDRTIYLLSTDGSSEKKLLTNKGNHLFPLWTPDGKSVIFASDRGQGMGAWRLDLATGAQTQLAANLGRFVPLGITAKGEYYYGVRSGGTDVYVSGRPVTLKFPDRNRAPEWSPDGNTLAYLSRRGTENFGQESRVIVLRAARGAEEREVLPKLAHIESVRWTPDGKSLLARGSDRQGRGGLFEVHPETAATKLVHWEESAGFRGFDGGYLDGKLIFLHDGGIRTKDAVLHPCPDARALTIGPARAAALCGRNTIAVFRNGTWNELSAPLANPQELAWLGDDLAIGDGQQAWLVQAKQKLDLPADRIPGISVHPNGKAIAYTAGSAQSEIWCLRLTD